MPPALKAPPAPKTVAPQPGAAPAARGTLYAPAGGVYLRGKFYQGGESLPVQTDAEEAMLRRATAHTDPARAAQDLRAKPAFGKGELEGQTETRDAAGHVSRERRDKKVVPSVGKADKPTYADKPVPQPRLGKRPAGGVRREHLPEELGQHLTDEEISRLSATSARKLIRTLNSLPPDEEYAQAALGGVAKRGWYARSHQALRGLFGAEAPRFAAVLAATSPNTAPRQNLEEALAVWEWYVGWREERQEAGLGLPTEADVRAKMVEWFGDPKAQKRKGIMGSKDANIARALTGDVNATGFDSLLSGHKVDSFRQNLLGDPHAVTGDLWMARLGELPASALGKKAVAEYLANSVKLRRVASLLNRRLGLEGQKDAWTPAEVQETTWAFVRALAEVGARSRRGEGQPLNPVQALYALTHGDVEASSDFLTLLSKHDPYAAKARESVRRLGLGKELDRTLRAYTASRASPAVRARTPRGAAVPRNLSGPGRDAAESVARRAGQYVPSFTGAVSRGKYSRPAIASCGSKSYNGGMTPIKYAANPAAPSQAPAPSAAGMPAVPSQGRQAAAAQGPTQDHPARGQYHVNAVSPNTEENLDFGEALERTRSSNHAAFKSIVKGVSQQLGLQGQIHSAVGDWEDGAENSLLQVIPHPANPEAVRYAAAWYGLLGNQRAVLTFHPDPKGTDSLYTIDLKGLTDVGQVRQQLQQAGVPFRTLVPGKQGTKVVIYDQNREWRSRVAKFAGAHNAVIRESVGAGSYLGGATRAAARAAYRRVITAYEAKHAQEGGGTLREVRQAGLGDRLGTAADANPQASHLSHTGPRVRYAAGDAGLGAFRTQTNRHFRQLIGGLLQAGKFGHPRHQAEAKAIASGEHPFDYAGHLLKAAEGGLSKLRGQDVQGTATTAHSRLWEKVLDPAAYREGETFESKFPHAAERHGIVGAVKSYANYRAQHEARSLQKRDAASRTYQMGQLPDEERRPQVAGREGPSELEWQDLKQAIQADLLRQAAEEEASGDPHYARRRAGLLREAAQVVSKKMENPYEFKSVPEASDRAKGGQTLALKKLIDAATERALGQAAPARKLAKSGPRLKFAGVNAPAGGVIVRGMFYPGGHFIPSANLEKASWDQYEQVHARRAKLKMSRREDGSYSYQAALAAQDSPEAVAKMAKVFHARDLLPTEEGYGPTPKPEVRPSRATAAGASSGGFRSHVEQPAKTPYADLAKQGFQAGPTVPADPLSLRVSVSPAYRSIGGRAVSAHNTSFAGTADHHLRPDLSPQEARQYISRLYNIARDFDQDVEEGRENLAPLDVIYKRHALWHDILRAEAEYRNRAVQGQRDSGPGRMNPWAAAWRDPSFEREQYTPEEQRQIIQRHHDNRALRELARHGLIDYPAEDRSGKFLEAMHQTHEVGLPQVQSLRGLYERLQSHGFKDDSELNRQAYSRIGHHTWNLTNGITRPQDVDDAIQHIRNQGIPLNADNARRVWAEARARRENL